MSAHIVLFILHLRQINENISNYLYDTVDFDKCTWLIEINSVSLLELTDWQNLISWFDLFISINSL